MFVQLPTLCIHTSWFKREQFNFWHEPIFLNEMFHIFSAVLLRSPILVVVVVVVVVFLALEEPEKTIGRGGPNDGISYVNFLEEKFFFLNITALGGDTVDDMPECSFACLDTPSCFSFNLAAFPDISNKLLCELLPSDKYYNSDKFIQSDTFHHFSIAVSEQARKSIYIF